ncbi:mediator of RNA polymerase II transcription subunit 6-like isoform X2 [Varroa jacobsoni]|nr:mediator of RNA polymerase II transcription subunit 6-like isoform X2 [Varroa jacobsoni]
MQRLDAEVMNEMTGLEYILLHVQEPILFIIRKQHRHSRTQVTPLADYYVLAGVVYQAPDLNTAVNSRLLSTVFHLQSAFEQAHSFSRYHPSKGYWWDFGKDDDDAKKKDKEKEDQKETASLFQRRRVDLLLGELARRYPPKLAPPSLPVMHQSQAPTNTVTAQAPAPPTASGTQQANTASAASTTQSNAATAANNNTAPTTNHKTPAAALKQGEGHPEKRPRIA